MITDTTAGRAAAPPVPVPAMALLGAALATLALLAHHPTLARGDGGRTAHLHAMVDLGGAAAAVHGLLGIVVLALLYGVLALGLALDARRPGVAFGMAAYGIGCAAILGAMLLDGYVMAALAERLLAPGMPPDDTVLFTLVPLCIQALTKAGLALMGIGMCCLSWSRARATRALAMLVPLAGLLPIVPAIAGGAWLRPHTLIALTGLQALWYAGAAWTLWRLPAAPAPGPSALSR